MQMICPGSHLAANAVACEIVLAQNTVMTNKEIISTHRMSHFRAKPRFKRRTKCVWFTKILSIFKLYHPLQCGLMLCNCSFYWRTSHASSNTGISKQQHYISKTRESRSQVVRFLFICIYITSSFCISCYNTNFHKKYYSGYRVFRNHFTIT